MNRKPRKPRVVAQLVSNGAVRSSLKKAGVRIGTNAAEELRHHLINELRKLGLASQKVLDIARRKTVQDSDVLEASKVLCPAICASKLAVNLQTHIGLTNIKKAAVVRAFQRGLKADTRVSDDAKNLIHNAAIHIVEDAKNIASGIAKAEKRVTIKTRDIQAALGKPVTAIKSKRYNLVFSSAYSGEYA